MSEKKVEIKEIQEQLYEFAAAMAMVVDERTPYNGNHTRQVVQYTTLMMNHLNRMYEAGRYGEYFDENRKNQLILAAYLHDIGKVIMPLSIMNKATRLGNRFIRVKERFKLLRAYYEIDYLKGACSEQVYEQQLGQLDAVWAKIKELNTKGQLGEQDFCDVGKMAKLHYKGMDGKEIPYLNAYEIQCLKIPRGTLTEEERSMMEQHVVMTEKILSNMTFSESYRNVKKWAVTHHECLDGSGYPNHLTAKELEPESRILAIADVYDALVCADRPYKDASTKEEAFNIMRNMAKNGKLDGILIDFFEEALEEKGGLE